MHTNFKEQISSVIASEFKPVTFTDVESKKQAILACKQQAEEPEKQHLEKKRIAFHGADDVFAEDREQFIRDHIHKAQAYEQAKIVTQEMADMERGIRWVKDDDTKLIIRDARGDDNSPNGNYADYLTQILGVGSAASDLLAIYDHVSERDHVNEQTYALGNNISKIVWAAVEEILASDDTSHDYCIKKAQEVNGKVVEQLKVIYPGYTAAKVQKVLGMAGDYSTYNSTHYSFATAYKVGDQTFAQVNEKISKKTEGLKEEYRDREGKEWYKALSQEERNLIDHHIKEISGDEHCIAIHNRHLPGIRNGYKTTLLQKKPGEEEFDTRLQYIRNGCISVISKAKDGGKEAHRLSELTRDHLLSIEKECNAELHVMSFNSDTPVYKEDREIIAESQDLFSTKNNENKKVSFVNIPINIFRRISTHHNKDACKQLIKSSLMYNDNLSSRIDASVNKFLSSDYDIGNRDYKKALNSLKDLDSPDKELLTSLVELKHTLNKTTGITGFFNRIFSPVNYQIILAAQYIHVTSLNKKSNLGTDICDISCKSGKDRTTVVSTISTINAIASHNSSIKREDIVKAAVDASADTVLSSINAGNPGRFGTLHVSLPDHSASERYIENITQSTAGSKFNIFQFLSGRGVLSPENTKRLIVDEYIAPAPSQEPIKNIPVEMQKKAQELPLLDIVESDSVSSAPHSTGKIQGTETAR